MLFLAASALDSMKKVTPHEWMIIGIAVAALVIAVIVLRKIASMNKIVLGVIAVVACSIVFFSWIYNRNEPKFMTPIIDRIAPFFPSAGSYATKQASSPKP